MCSHSSEALLQKPLSKLTLIYHQYSWGVVTHPLKNCLRMLSSSLGPLSLGPINVILSGKSLCRCNEVKDLQMRRLPWIIQMDPKHHSKRPYKRERQRKITDTHRRQLWRGRGSYKPMDANDLQKLEQARNRFSPKRPEGMWPDKFFSCERINFYCFKSLHSC